MIELYDKIDMEIIPKRNILVFFFYSIWVIQP